MDNMENERQNAAKSIQNDFKSEPSIPRFEDSKNDEVQNKIAEKFSQYKNDGEVKQVTPPPKPPVYNKPVSNYENAKPAYIAVEQQRAQNSSLGSSSYFDGNMLDLWGLRVLQAFITALTAGLAGPWISCIVYNYKCKHTYFNGKRLRFDGDPVELFLLTFRWYIFTLLSLGIYALFIPQRKAMWIASNIHFDGESKEDSYFTGSPIGYIGVNLLCAILPAISFGLLFPFAECYKMRWICKNSVINGRRIEFVGRAGSLFGNYIKWIFLSAITCGIYGLWLEVNFIKWKVKNIRVTSAADGRRQESEKSSVGTIVAIVIGAVVIIGLLFVLVPMIFGIFKNSSNSNTLEKNLSVAEEKIRYDALDKSY